MTSDTSDTSDTSLYPPLRTMLAWLHAVASLSWLSQALGLGVLVSVSVASPPGHTKVFAADAAELLDSTVLVYSANTAAATGLFLAALTTWGYFHWWWVTVKFAMTAGQLYAGIFILSLSMPEVVAAAQAGTEGPARMVAGGAFLMVSGLAFQAWLSIAKPWGRTAVGRRSRVRPSPAPNWLMILAIVAPIVDVPFGQLIGDPAPALSIFALVVAIVLRQRRFRAERTAAAGGESTPGRVESIDTVAAGIKVLRLAPVRGTTAQWTPGAHIDLHLPSGLIRQYSLAGDPNDRAAYQVAVLLESDGRGGSAEIHELEVGDRIEIGGPRNNFPLVDAPSYLFVAGGIGITPFLPMIHDAERRGRPWRLIYRGARREHMAFADTLADSYAGKVDLLPADQLPRPDLAALLADQPQGTAAYCCGPATMLDAFERAVTTAPGVSPHLERFTPLDLENLPSEPFEVVLAYSRQKVRVPAEKTMLDALRPALPDVPASCETGVCGTCVLDVLAGRPDHRDAILHGPDRERTDLIYPCVSRALDQRLVLDA